jgi:hypothetical protein
LPEEVILKQNLLPDSHPKWRDFDLGWNVDRVLTAPIIKAYNITRVIITRERFLLKEDVMKKLLLMVSILALVLVPIGCNVQSMLQSTIESALAGISANYTIEVTDTEGFNFTGRYVVVTAEYDPVNYVAFNSTSYDVVSENVSKEYTVTNAIEVGGMFQKLSPGNETLTVRILKGGVEVDSATTTDPFGAVLVTAVKES